MIIIANDIDVAQILLNQYTSMRVVTAWMEFKTRRSKDSEGQHNGGKAKSMGVSVYWQVDSSSNRTSEG